MALSIEKVLFVKSGQYLGHQQWDESSNLGLVDFAINIDGRVVQNRFGEMLLRFNRVETGKYMYVVATMFGSEIEIEDDLNFDIVCCGYDLKWFLDEYYNESRMDTEYINDYDDEPHDAEKYVDDEPEYPTGYDSYDDWCGENYTLRTCPPAPEGFNTWGDWYDNTCIDESCFDDDVDDVSITPVIAIETEKCIDNYTFSNDMTLIPGINDLNSNYSRRYFLVLDCSGKPIQSQSGKYLSRLQKDNGSYRYYLTSYKVEMVSDEYDRMSKFNVFTSSFIGSELTSALSYL